MSLTVEKLECVTRKLLPAYCGVIFLATVFGAFTLYIEHDMWSIGDWLINYSGGFIRRGLVGNLIICTTGYTHINSGLLATLLVSLFYGTFFIFSCNLLRHKDNISRYFLLIFSPYVFTFQINCLYGGYRKEIIYLAILSFVVWTAQFKRPRVFEQVFYLVLVVYPMVILSHEMLAIFLPYILSVYVLKMEMTRTRILALLVLVLPSLLSLAVSLSSSGSSDQVRKIFSSLNSGNYSLSGGAIAWLEADSNYGIQRVMETVRDWHYEYYAVILLVAFIAFLPVRSQLYSLAKNRVVRLLVSLSLVGSISLFVFALDWGRFIYIHLVSVFLLVLLVPSAPIPERKLRMPIGSVGYIGILIVIIYSQFWCIPHYHPAGNVFVRKTSDTNVVKLSYPFRYIWGHVFSSGVTKP